MRDRLGLERGDAAADGGDADVLEPDERARRGVARVPLLAVERVDQRAGGAGVADLPAGAGGGGAHEPGARAVHRHGRERLGALGVADLAERVAGAGAQLVVAIAQRGGQLGHGVERAQLAEHDDDQAAPLRVARVAEQRAQLVDGVGAGVEQHLGHRALPEVVVALGQRAEDLVEHADGADAGQRVRAREAHERLAIAQALAQRGHAVEAAELADDLGGAHAVQHHARAQPALRLGDEAALGEAGGEPLARGAGELVGGLEQRLAQQPPLEGRERARELVGDLDREGRDALAHAHAACARVALAHALVGQQHAHA